MNTPMEILHRYRIRPNKRLGQSFLVDVNTIHKIAAAAQVTSEDIVLEIGAGIGVMTQQIARIAKRVIAVEIDPLLVEILRDQLAGFANVEIHSGDILKLDFNSISIDYNAKIKVIGNIPYNISSPVIFHLLSHRSVIGSFMLMLQKEVVERLVSPPNCKSYGVPSVLLQMHAAVEKYFDVSPGCFYPVPKVSSAVIGGVFREMPLLALSDEEHFTRLVKASFAQRRKMLMNNLKHAGFLEGLTDDDLQSTLDKAGIDGKRRGETLSVAEFGHLSNMLKNRLAKPAEIRMPGRH